MTPSAYPSLIALLNSHRARYRLLDHPAEGRTEVVSLLRGHPPAQAAKCIVVMVKSGKKVTRYVLAVVRGDMQVDLDAIKLLLGGTYVAFASRGVAESLGGAEAGAIIPFPLSNDLELIVDPLLLAQDQIFFNAGRLDRSVELRTADYVAIARPRLERIARKPLKVQQEKEMVEKVRVADKFEAFDDYWSPKIVGELNDLYIKAVKFKGEFVWHHHDDEDELFYVVKGRIVIKLRDGEVELQPGEFAVIPHMVEHMPVADEEAHVLLMERKTTLNTGTITNDRTVARLGRV